MAVVVGSGGLKCAAALGMWKALIRARIPIDLTVGCSGGALYAAAMALDMPVAQMEQDTLRLCEGLFRRVRYRTIARELIMPRSWRGHRMGLLDDHSVNEALLSLFAETEFAQTRIPLFLTATDVLNGDTHTISNGRIRDGIRASVAIPLLLRPWWVGDRLLMDGGASDPLPISTAIREGAQIILAMGFETPVDGEPDSVLAMASRTLAVTVNHLLRSTYAFYSAAHHAEIIPLIPDVGCPVRLTDTHLVPRLIELGEQVTEAQVPYIKRLLHAKATAQGELP